MGVNYSPRIITDGLVFYYDMHNTLKSFKGKPLTNYYGDISTSDPIRSPVTSHFWNGSSWLVNGVYTHPGIDGPKGVYLGLVYKHTSGALSSTWSGNSYGYMLKNITSTIGNTYTMSTWVYVSEDCNIDVLFCSTENTTVNNIDVTGYQSSYNLTNKGSWQIIARSAVSDGLITWIPVYPSIYGVIDGSFNGFFMWGAVQVEDGTNVNSYVGDNLSYVRTNTQSVLDITSNNTITVNDLTYNIDNTFTFDGINDYLSIPSIDFSNEQTIEIWLKPSENDGNRRNPYNQSYGGYGTWTHEPAGGISYYYGDAGSDAAPYVGHGSPFNVEQDEIACVCTTRDTFESRWYKNGIYYNNYPHGYGTLTVDNNPILIGNGYAGAYMGNIYSVKLYNRALTEYEVFQNFNSIRSKYGL